MQGSAPVFSCLDRVGVKGNGQEASRTCPPPREVRSHPWEFNGAMAGKSQPDLGLADGPGAVRCPLDAVSLAVN